MVVRTSGNILLDRAAMSAIRRIKMLQPLPASIGSDQMFRANIVFAIDEKTLAREEQALRIASARDLETSPPGQTRPIQLALAISHD